MPIQSGDDFYDSDEDEGAQTALLSLSVLGGRSVKQGDTITLRVTRVMPDQVEVEYPEPGEDEAGAMEAGMEDDEMPPVSDGATPAMAGAVEDDMYA
jgi:hypothetical protein